MLADTVWLGVLRLEDGVDSDDLDEVLKVSALPACCVLCAVAQTCVDEKLATM